MYKIISVRRALSSVFLAATAALLASCGGGGASSDSGVVSPGPLSLNPPASRIFAGTPLVLTMSGGRPPYQIVSSEPSIIKAPDRPLDQNQRQITFIPTNPSFTEAGTAQDEIPNVDVTLTVRDNAGNSAQATVKVLRNAVVAEPVVIQRLVAGIGCAPPSTGSGGDNAATTSSDRLCFGDEFIMQIRALNSGNLRANRQVRFDVQFTERPDDLLFREVSSTRVPTRTAIGITDELGIAKVRGFVSPNASTQIAVVRITDVETERFIAANGQDLATGGYTINTIFIVPPDLPAPTPLEVLPSEAITLTGANTASCGTGSVDYYIFGGTPPYSVVSPRPDLATVSVSVVSVEGGRFTATIRNCGTVQFVVVDALGQRIETAALTSSFGTVVAPTPLTVAPGTLTLGCGQVGNVIAAGGNATKVVNSGDVCVQATAASGGGGGGGTTSSGTTITITRATTGSCTSTVTPPPATVDVPVTVTDGVQSATVSVTTQRVCP